jgi:hypothetical protein
MQNVFFTNWCKIILSISAFILSASILILALKGNTAYAKEGSPKLPDTPDFYIVADGAKAYKIKYNAGLGQWDITQIGRLR